MVGMAPFVALGVTSLVRNRSRSVKLLVCLLALATLVLLAGSTRQRVDVWRNATTLWSDAVVKTPKSPIAQFALAEVYFKAGRHADARQLLQALTTNFPERVAPYELLANLFYVTGDMNSAREYYLKALSLKPDLPNANLCLGNIYLAEKQTLLAIEKFHAAEKVTPTSPDAAYSLACAEALLNRNDVALDYLDKAFRYGFRGCQAVTVNHELDSLRGEPGYEKIMSQYCH
jgi:predicted Zn-dependent protease